ncbi:unnamed protein product [Heligmosomoides polygyrus]|uniref:Secreted protein n=1 Tax=Heligmosomoides polygyrus TaxID=6339 RepID=A0A183F819_HELPZ|nr:unnamed protein product [Heligmosomoides polygyrus]
MLGLRKMVTTVTAVLVVEHATLMRDSHLVSFYSGSTKTQIGFILVKHRGRRLSTNAKVVPYETITTSTVR